MALSRIWSIEIEGNVGQVVNIKGWLHNLRALGSVNFLILRDGWGLIQCVVGKDIITLLGDVQTESIIHVTGHVVAAKQAPGGVELHDCKVEIIEPVTQQLPYEINQKTIKAGLDTFLNYAQLGLRHPKKRSLLRLASGVMQGFRQTLSQLGFTEIQTPKLVGSATEGGANVFTVDYFGQPAYLAQSPQFYKQMMVGIFERVYEIGPVFRAESHNTSRHINEYVSLDVELGFIEDHTTVMHLLYQVIQGMLNTLNDLYQNDLNLLDINIPLLDALPPIIHFKEAQDMLYTLHGEYCQGEPDLSPQQERWLGQWAKEEHNSDFLFVTGYPMAKRPFYTHPSPEDPTYSNSFDLLFRGTELVTGGQRLHRYQDYVQALQNQGLPTTAFEGYLTIFRYGMPPHGGFAIGLERFLMQLTGLSNIREATLFPRDLNRLTP